MVITKIEAQKKKGRYNIYLNDAFAFGVDEATVVKYALFKGTELTKVQIKEIQQDDCIQQAYQKALHFLNFKLRSTKEVYEKLEKLEFDDDIINEVLGKLHEQNFLNDRQSLSHSKGRSLSFLIYRRRGLVTKSFKPFSKAIL